MAAISRCPRRSAHASGVAHGSSSGRLAGAPRASRKSTISREITARRPCERRRAVLDVLRGNRRARIEENRGALGSVLHRSAAHIAAAQRVKQRDAFRCRIVRAQSSSREQHTQHVWTFQQIRLASARNGRYCDTRVEQAHHERAVAACHHSRVHTAAAGVRRCGIVAHACASLLHRHRARQGRMGRASAVCDEQRAQCRCSRGEHRIACRIDKGVWIGAVCEKQLDERPIAGARGGVKGRAPRRIVRIGPRRVGSTLDQAGARCARGRIQRQPTTAACCSGGSR